MITEEERDSIIKEACHLAMELMFKARPYIKLTHDDLAVWIEEIKPKVKERLIELKDSEKTDQK